MVGESVLRCTRVQGVSLSSIPSSHSALPLLAPSSLSGLTALHPAWDQQYRGSSDHQRSGEFRPAHLSWSRDDRICSFTSCEWDADSVFPSELSAWRHALWVKSLSPRSLLGMWEMKLKENFLLFPSCLSVHYKHRALSRVRTQLFLLGKGNHQRPSFHLLPPEGMGRRDYWNTGQLQECAVWWKAQHHFKSSMQKNAVTSLWSQLSLCR